MNAPTRLAEEIADPLLIAGRAYRSRLLIGTGKYRDFDETRRAVEASGAEIVTVAIRRTKRRRDRHRRHPPHQHRPERERALAAGGPAAQPIHDSPQHGRLLQRR